MVSSSHSISTCRPWHSTRSMVRPARGVRPISRGASKRIIFSSTSAVRSAAAARWIESPSGIRPQPYAGDGRRAGILPGPAAARRSAQVANATRRPSRMAAAAVRGARQSPIDVWATPSPSSSAESSTRATGVPATTSQSKRCCGLVTSQRRAQRRGVAAPPGDDRVRRQLATGDGETSAGRDIGGAVVQRRRQPRQRPWRW